MLGRAGERPPVSTRAATIGCRSPRGNDTARQPAGRASVSLSRRTPPPRIALPTGRSGRLSHPGVLDFAGLDRPHDPTRHAHDAHAVRHRQPRRDHGTGGHHAPAADRRPPQHRRAHADQRAVADGHPVDDRAVADHDVVADVVRHAAVAVDDGVVLHVGAASDRDGGDVAADDGVEPNAGVGTGGDVADDRGVVSPVRAVAVAGEQRHGRPAYHTGGTASPGRRAALGGTGRAWPAGRTRTAGTARPSLGPHAVARPR